MRADDSSPYRGRSILIFGSGDAPMAVFASALAREEVGTFGWADFTGPEETPTPGARQVLEASSDTPREPSVRAEDLLAPTGAVGGLSTWLVRDPLSAEAAGRLAAYLRLPSLLQRMVSRVMTINARAVLVLTNVDALAIPTVERALGSAEVHETLHREGVTLLVTFRGTPSDLLRAPFERIYRVDGHPGQVWQDAPVTLERGESGDGFPPGAPLGRRLPGLGLTGTPAEGQSPIAGHRLR
ncbi:MAG: hypothetical protein L3K02_03030 [Thermoplasmata archaeon]|nr:hypothetical protein [Thermoplasmata archaeon]